jgi:glycosyltransferase involved in cell wall biosynthesis
MQALPALDSASRPQATREEGAAELASGRVSVVVPTRNSARTLEACLASVRAQAYPDVELIVVDNDSTDGTAEVASAYADRLLAAGPERSAQRNAGASAASGEFLVFVDDDMVLPRELARELVEAFSLDASVQALVLPERSFGEGFWARCRALEKELYLGQPSVEAARAFRRSTFVAAGGYDERIHGGGEDWDLPERVARAGGRVGRVAAVVLHDEGRLTLRRDLTKKLYYGRTFRRYAAKHPGSALRKIARPPLFGAVCALVRHPAHGPGLLVLKALELSALLAGVLVSFVRAHPAERRAGGRAR